MSADGMQAPMRAPGLPLARWLVSRLGVLLVALAGLAGLTGLVGPAAAQTLDEVDVRVQGDQRIVRIRFNASVSYLQIVPSGSSDQYTLRFDLLSADDGVLRQSVGESRRLPAADGMPELVVAYTPEPGARTRHLSLRLGRALPLRARQGPNARSIELLLRNADLLAPGAAAAAAAATAPGIGTASAPPASLASPEVEAQAAALLDRAWHALAARDGEAAVALLNQALKLPPHSRSMLAQELIGDAWELARSPERARVEYALYLKLYPQGDGAARVAQRLAALGGPPVAAAADAAGAASAAGTGAGATRSTAKPFSGSIAQYYYGGKARTKSLVNIATGIDQATISRTSESAIVTSADLSARYGGETSETRAVLRGSTSTNLLSSGHSSSSIGSAYLEYRRTGGGGAMEGLGLRAGRQSPISGGLLGLFDGVSMILPLKNGLKLDLMGGVPASALVSAPGERLLAAVLEADSFFERFGGNLYLLQQTTQGITNRRALGSELRYAGERWSLNTLLDVDTVFGKVNAASVHGSAQVGEQTHLTLLADERRAPSLQLTNALISSGAASLRTLLQTRSLAQVKADALATSATAKQVLVSLARPLNERWQVATDLRYSAVGALPAVGDFEATPATGAQLGWSVQLTGTGIRVPGDVHNANLSLLRTPFFKGVQLAYNNLTPWSAGGDLTLEPSLRLYWQRDKQDVRLLRWGPGLRAAWKAGTRGSLLGELLYEGSKTDGPSNHDSSHSLFFYIGYRYELF